MIRTWVLATTCGVVLLQVLLARYTIGGQWAFDLVLVGVVFSALHWGVGAGLAAGTLGGLLLDVLSGSVVGVGGLAKTLVGSAAGAVGATVVVTQLHARVLIVGLATVVHRAIVLGLTALIEGRWPGVSWTAMLEELVLNAGAGLLLFAAVERVPGAVARGRARRRAWRGRPRW